MPKLVEVKLPVENHDKRIKPRSHYLARINREWYAGRFSKQWYGWNFESVYDAGFQVDYRGWQELYEIVP